MRESLLMSSKGAPSNSLQNYSLSFQRMGQEPTRLDFSSMGTLTKNEVLQTDGGAESKDTEKGMRGVTPLMPRFSPQGKDMLTNIGLDNDGGPMVANMENLRPLDWEKSQVSEEVQGPMTLGEITKKVSCHAHATSTPEGNLGNNLVCWRKTTGQMVPKDTVSKNHGNKRERHSDGGELEGPGKKGRKQGLSLHNKNGSGMAAAVEQPRQPK